jgi:hypothetical protein
MKQAVTTILIAAVVSGLVVQAYRTFGSSDGMAEPPDAASDAPPAAVQVSAAAEPSLSFTDALVEDVWIDAARTAGDDHRSLTNADNSICFITKIELSGIQGPEDTSSCRMEIDDFTGFWDLVAEVEEGGQSAIRCNARCLIWE